MPRGNKKQKKGRRGGGDSRQPSDDENDTPDNMSTVSSQSDTQSIAEAVGTEDEVDETSTQEDFEDKLKEVIEGITQKSAKGRVDSLKSLRVAFCKKFIDEFLIDRKITICDGIERCLRKGKGDEQAAAATCGVLLLLQLGAGDDGEEIYKALRPILQVIMADTSASTRARAACADALGMAAFIAGGEIEQALEVMKALENIFKKSYLKGDGSTPSHTPDVVALHNSALSSWCLLLSIAPQSVINDLVYSHLSKLPELLTSPVVELRITAGEAIALLYELAKEDDEDFEGSDIEELCETLKELATDSNKYRAKKDRRQQRSSFRDILRAVENGEVPSCRIKFGMESIGIDRWATKKQYDTLCHFLASGMNVHLAENDLIRDIFGLGAPMLDAKPQKTGKLQRHLYNAAAFKARTKIRSKTRDKRAVHSHMDS